MTCSAVLTLLSELSIFHARVLAAIHRDEHAFDQNAHLVAEQARATLKDIPTRVSEIRRTCEAGYIDNSELVGVISSNAELVSDTHKVLARMPMPQPSRQLTAFVNEQAQALGIGSKVAVSLSARNGFLQDFVDQDQALRPAFVANIHLGTCHNEDPFYWPFLVHELGHVLYRERSDIHIQSGIEGLERKVASRWTEELVCDAIATRMFGPAYLAPFLLHALLFQPEHLATSTHPFPQLRVRLITRMVGEPDIHTAGLSALLDLAINTTLAVDAVKDTPLLCLSCGKTTKSTAKGGPETFDDAIQEVIEKVERALPRGWNVSAIAPLARRLRAQQIVPTSPEVGSADLGIMHSPRAQAAKSFRRAVARYRETANKPADILSAGWKDWFIACGATDAPETRDSLRELVLRSLQTRATFSVVQTALETSDRVGPEPEPIHLRFRCHKHATEGNGLLSDADIYRRMLREELTERIVITPVVSLSSQLSANSFDVRLGTEFIVFRNTRHESFDPMIEPEALDRATEEFAVRVHVAPLDYFVIHPREFVLGTTLEQVVIPKDLAATLEGKSTWARLGLEVHATAGFVDTGFSGKLTYEIKNHGRMPIRLYPGMLVAQICFHSTSSAPFKPYAKGSGHKYQHQLTVQPARLSKDKELRKLGEWIRNRRRQEDKEKK